MPHVLIAEDDSPLRKQIAHAIDYGIPVEIERTIKTPLPKLLSIVNECFDDLL